MVRKCELNQTVIVDKKKKERKIKQGRGNGGLLI